MSINPVSFTEKVIRNFLKYQLTEYPFADPDLYAQMRSLLSLDESRHTPLFKGPYVSLSQSFREGGAVKDLIDEDILHSFMQRLIPFEHLYGHQEKAIRSIVSGSTTLISTGTGSGKTECFLYPIISRCLKLRDEGAPAGIVAVLVYPMNALAEDQLLRLRGILAGTGITFGMYTGRTPNWESEVSGKRLKTGSSNEDYQRELIRAQEEKRKIAVQPPEERCSREKMRTRGEQPRILITNVKQLELLLTRSSDVELFDNSLLEFLIFDEAHTYRGAIGAETACLIRRLRAYVGRDPKETVCVATSATITDPERGAEAGREFAARFFGVEESGVVLVGEEYTPDIWASDREITPPFPGDPSEHLQAILKTVDIEDGPNPALVKAFESATGIRIDENNWQEELYKHLSRNDVVYQLAELLKRPLPLDELLEDLEKQVGREVPEEEVLAWLALGAASRQNGRPLLRPVIHGFVRGIGGATVSFPEDEERPQLSLGIESDDEESLIRLPVMTCTTCGQHYFEHHVKDFHYVGDEPGGGDAIENRKYWETVDKSRGGTRVVLTDHVIGTEEDDDEPTRTSAVFICRKCGALHPGDLERCDSCGSEGPLVRLLAIQQKEDHLGNLTRCISCAAQGKRVQGRYREPARPVRALTVSDVHVLAQDMVHHSERQRLLVFTDNRQDAAFQAGWMQDHARRFRLRSLMAERINAGPVSIGDLTIYLDEMLENDDGLSLALVPEVWKVARKEAAGFGHSEKRKEFLRIQVLREITMTMKQRLGLEPWGRMRIEYLGLEPDLLFIQKHAPALGLEPEQLVDGIAGLLDWMRRSLFLYDKELHLFDRTRQSGDWYVQRGFLPEMKAVPRGIKLKRDGDSESNRISYWLGRRGDTVVRKALKGWGVDPEHVDDFAAELWKFLTHELQLLVPVTLTGPRGRAIPGCGGAYQIDADKLRLVTNRGFWQCSKCRRIVIHRAPHDKCIAYRCDGTMHPEKENPDDYNLALLDGQFSMVRPREHSAQVPSEDRETIERIFKGTSDTINALVCTPTLELGVDIGVLDTVLMRNVPPLPANYWQRVGRAGRRHRMAVNLIYCRPVSHDRMYFDDPIRMLQGLVEPPRFNMRNEKMVIKHLHAAALTRLHQLSRDNSNLPESDRNEINITLRESFPREIKDYLFNIDGMLRPELFDLSAVNTVTSKHEEDILAYIFTAFSQGWPVQDEDIVSQEKLREYYRNIAGSLSDVIGRLKKRLDWAMKQLQRLDELRRSKGTLDSDEQALHDRCDRLVQRLKGIRKRRRRESEGYDDINTLGVLAAEGFLPGYGLEIGAVRGTAHIPEYIGGSRDFDLPRPTSIAVREYVPGNLIYANGHRFVARYYHLEAVQPTMFQVDTANQAVGEIGIARAGTGNAHNTASMGVSTLRAVPICDVDLPHQSHISDDEEYRFQMPVSVYGYELDRHNGGKAYKWGDQNIMHRRNVHIRLVNVGPTHIVDSDRNLGYPVCLVCGQSRSPFSSSLERDRFIEDHQTRCGDSVEHTGFFADVIADALSISGCTNRDEAYSLMEAIRTGAAMVLEMERDDLQILVIGHPGSDQVDAILYDPMPGGSGLIDQIIQHFISVYEAALEVTLNCPADCQRSCVDCLWTYRNAFFHKHLDRKLAGELIETWGSELSLSHDIPPLMQQTAPRDEEYPVNVAEDRLRGMLHRAGFSEPEWHHQILLGKPLGSTSPDCFFAGDDDDDPGLCIYLDGLSRHIHGRRETFEKDQAIRNELRSRGYIVIEIAATELDDRDAMSRHFFKLGRWLIGKDRAKDLRDNTEWFIQQ